MTPQIVPDDALLTAGCEIDFLTFVREAWPTVVTAEPFVANWHIDAICEHLEALSRREFWNLLINVIPKSGKSTLCSVMFPAWLWLQDPTMRVISSSYAQSLSTRDNLATRRLIESQWYQSRWGDRFTIVTDQNEKTRFENDKRGMRLATSVGGVTTGETGDLWIIDDPHNVSEAESEAERRNVLNWWNVAMPSRVGRGGRSLRVVVMQRCHEEDLSGDILKKDGWVVLCLPMEYESSRARRGWNGWEDPRREDGELLWPARFSREVISATLKPPHMTSVAYAGQYQQRPAPAGGGMFLRDRWQFHRRRPEDLIEKAQDKCWSWDMAFKDLKSSSFVCGTAWARIGADFFMLPHAVHDHLLFGGSKMAVRTCAGKWPGIHYKLVEDKANGTAAIEDLRHVVGGLTPINPQGGKESRASVVQAYQEAGNVYLPDPKDCPWVEDFIAEHDVFPNGTHDDWVDSTSQALSWMVERMEKGFAPITWSSTKTFTPKMSSGVTRPLEEGTEVRTRRGTESYRDPRGDEPRSTSAPVVHDVNGAGHRGGCRQCRRAWRESEVGYSERGDMRKSDADEVK